MVFGFLASGGSLYFTTTPLKVFVSANRLPESPKFTLSVGLAAAFAEDSCGDAGATLCDAAAAAAASILAWRDSALCFRRSRRTDPLEELVMLYELDRLEPLRLYDELK